MQPARIAENQRAATRIIGGEASTQKEWPWQTALFIRLGDGGYALDCGGSVVAPTWVLSAAHGFSSNPAARRAENWVVATDVKALSASSLPAGAKLSRVKRIIVHEGSDGERITNDIALMELAEPLTVPPIQRQSRADASIEQNREATVTGWRRGRNIEKRA